jgi:hypothetical protein
MSAVSRNQFLKGMEKTLDDVFMAGYDLKGDQYSQVFDVRTSEKRQEEDLEIIYPSEIETANEGGMYQRVTIESGRTKQYLHLTYKAEIKITEEMIEDVMYAKIVDASKALGIAAKRTVEKKCAQFFVNGFTSELTPDGLPVFSAVHLVDAPEAGKPTTWSNLINDAFSSTAVKKLRTLMRKTRDQHGDLSPHMMDQLIVNSDLEWDAGELLESNLLADTANNAKNTVGRGLKLIVLDHLSDASVNADTIFFGRDGDMAMNKFYWRVKPQTGFINEEASGDPIWRARMRFSLGASSPRGLVASTGTVG